MPTMTIDKINTFDNVKLENVMNKIRTFQRKQKDSNYIAYIDHSDYCIGFFDNG